MYEFVKINIVKKKQFNWFCDICFNMKYGSFEFTK